MAKKPGTRNFSEAETSRLVALVEQGASISEASRAMGRSYWTLRRHSQRLGLNFRVARPRSRPRKTAPLPGAAARRARLRQVEDWLIRGLAAGGWSSGMAAIELDLDQSVLWRNSKRLGVTWTRYGGRSVKGEPVSGVRELRRLRARVRGDRESRPG